MAYRALPANQGRISQGERWHCCWRGGFRESGMCQLLLAHSTTLLFNSFAKLCTGRLRNVTWASSTRLKMSIINYLSPFWVSCYSSESWLTWSCAGSWILGVCWRAHLELYLLERNCSWSYTLFYLTLGKKINITLFKSGSEGCLVNPKISRSIYKCASNTFIGDWSSILAKQNSK